jgi:hypothetical protein
MRAVARCHCHRHVSLEWVAHAAILNYEKRNRREIFRKKPVQFKIK